MSEKTVSIGDRQESMTVEKNDASWIVRKGDRIHTIELISLHEGRAELLIGGRLHDVAFLATADGLQFTLDGETFTAVVGVQGRSRGRHREQSMAAPMPGLVLKISVAPGDEVHKGDPLVVLEAMKMEHQIVAARDGRVAAVHCSVGELVQPGFDLVTLEEEPQQS
jgi:acetyl/propionyl-CoA carboxylase alpha subunit